MSVGFYKHGRELPRNWREGQNRRDSRFRVPLFFDRRAAGIERDRNLIGRSAPMLDEEEFHNRTGESFCVKKQNFFE